MSLLRAWFNAHNSNLNQKINAQEFVKLFVPMKIIEIIKKSTNRDTGQVSLRDPDFIIDKDNIGATRTGLRRNTQELMDMYGEPEVQYWLKDKLLKYVNKYLLGDECWEKNCRKFFKELRKALESSYDKKTENNSDLERLGRLLEYGDKDTNTEVRDALYYYLFYAITKTLPEQFSNVLYENYEKDFREYCALIVENLGVYTFQGMSTLYALAERGTPNVCALYAVGELEYYGRGRSGIRNIPLAYRYYKKVIDINESHPRALWAIADLKLSYPQLKEEYGEALRIDEFETYINKPEWYLSIIRDAKRAALYGSAVGENLLGRIIEADEKMFPKTYKGELAEESAEDHYKRAAEKGYAFAYVNLAKIMSRKSKRAETQVDKNDYNEMALEYYKQASNLGISHASNKLSRCYLGIDDEITVRRNEDTAYQYAQAALVYAKMMHHTFYPFLNIVKNFYANPDSNYYNAVEREQQLLYLNNAEKTASGIDDVEYQRVQAEITRLREFINQNDDCNNSRK